MTAPSARFGIVGALSAFPRRLAARALAARGAELQRGITRRTSHVALGRTLLEKWSEAVIAQRVASLRATGAVLMSEDGLLRWLGLLPAPAAAELGRKALLEQSGMDGATFDLLAMFDAFAHDREPFSFRDLILAKKYAGLLAGGTHWSAVVRAAHATAPATSLTALSLHPEGSQTIYALDGKGRTELDGQRVLPLPQSEAEADDHFERAEAAEAAGLHAEAAELYLRCLTVDPADPVAAFNRANCLEAVKDESGAAFAYALALRNDPGFVEAWFNYAGLLHAQGKTDAARQHLLRAITLDPDYADAIYNLARLEFELENLVEARRWWARYLELDSSSEWARTAARGLAYANMKLNKVSG